VAAAHVVVESGLALVQALAQITLELRGLPRAAQVVVLHAPHAAALELAALQEGERREEKVNIPFHSGLQCLLTLQHLV